MPANWITVSESSFPWERDALEFIRSEFPAHEPYQAWSNFEFIADDGSINEVDLLVFSPQGFFLIEIKSRPGRVRGDAGTWTWETPGKHLATVDNPLLLANAKAKKLRSLLRRQKACKRKGQVPWIDAIVFLSAPDLQLDLRDNAAFGVRLRDTETRPGIMGAIRRRECPGLRPRHHDRYDRPTGKMVAQAIGQAGIRPSQRSRRVGDYLIEQLIDEGPGFQDWHARHATLESVRRRVRIYNVHTGATDEERETIRRAGQREAELLESLQHPGVLRREGFTQHELGPALIFEHQPDAIRLDHFLSQHAGKLSFDRRVDLVRQIAEVVRFAHEKRVVHRALCPQSVLVVPRGVPRRPADPSVSPRIAAAPRNSTAPQNAADEETKSDADAPAGESRVTDAGVQVKLFNWQLGFRGGTLTAGTSRAVTATSHADRLVDDARTAYMAPEAISDDVPDGDQELAEYLDVFSLGAIAYHVFTGQPPASSGLELSNRLRETKGLSISSVLNGAGESLQELVQWSTLPDVAERSGLIGTAKDFLDLLDKVEEEATSPPPESFVEDPNRARKDDLLPENLRVVRRLGQGACSVVLLVERDGDEFVLKVANDPDHNERLRGEAEVLGKLRHSHIVECCGTLEIGDRFAFLMRPVFANKDERRIETLRDRLHHEGRLHIDLLQRFGEDLLDVVKYLEDEAGIAHRDLKPDNIAIGQIKHGNKLHLVLFDFSLSRVPAENVRAGTKGYLDPMLPLRKNRRADLHVDRFAAAATLYELATGPGNLPRWGDGLSDPSHLTCEATIDGDLFEPSMRDALVEFFTRAFRRDPAARFDSAERMLAAWRDCFLDIEQPGVLTDHEDSDEFRELLASATFDTQIPELGLGTRATNALDRANILTVEDLLTVSMYRLNRLRGVGQKTRREISLTVKILRERLGKPSGDDVSTIDLPDEDAATDVETLGVDPLVRRLTRVGPREGASLRITMHALLGLSPPNAGTLPREIGGAVAESDMMRESDATIAMWPSQAEVAVAAGVTRARVGQLVAKLQTRWSRDPALNHLRTEVAEIIDKAGGAMSVSEAAEAVLVARGSASDEPLRTRSSIALVRACIEVERSRSQPRFLVRREGDRVILANSPEMATYALRLGDEADRLADEDPLVPPVRALQRLGEIGDEEGVGNSVLTPFSDTRAVRLAAAASTHAAVSSRQEFYPRGMDAARALKLSRGALYGVARLTVNQIRSRIASRYPEAEPLPGRPKLDELLTEAGFEFRWDESPGGEGAYISPLRDMMTITSGSESVSRIATPVPTETGEVTPELADRRQFDERLTRAVKEGSFLTLMVSPKRYRRAVRLLSERYPVETIDMEGLFLDALRQVAEEARVDWDLVLKADAKPGSGDWNKLLRLIGRAMPKIEQRLMSSDKTILMIYPGLIARYDQMPLLQRLRDQVGRKDGIPGLWLLIPGSNQATINGKPVPLISPGQRTKVPDAWV